MSGISVKEFQTKVESVRKEYSEKYREIQALQNKFQILVNSIELTTKLPDDVNDPDYLELCDMYDQEKDSISNVVSDLAYDFDLEWDGSFEEGDNSFWMPSNC